jgi:hypothetical protein
MEVQMLIGVMGTLCVIATYFWVVRPAPTAAEAK